MGCRGFGYWRVPWLVCLHPRPRLALRCLLALLIRADGAQAFALLRLSTSLCTAAFDLRGNRLGPAGVQPLVAALPSLPRLHTLHLDLCDNSLGPSGIAALAACLQRCPALARLTLTLKRNCLGAGGAHALCAFHDAPALCSLTLDLRSNSLTEADAHALAEVTQAPRLQDLTLYLCVNALGPAGAGALASALGRAQGLQTLRLTLSGNGCGAGGVQAFQAVRGLRMLKALSLDLRNNGLNMADVKALALLKVWPASCQPGFWMPPLPPPPPN